MWLDPQETNFENWGWEVAKQLLNVLSHFFSPEPLKSWAYLILFNRSTISWKNIALTLSFNMLKIDQALCTKGLTLIDCMLQSRHVRVSEWIPIL